MTAADWIEWVIVGGLVLTCAFAIVFLLVEASVTMQMWALRRTARKSAWQLGKQHGESKGKPQRPSSPRSRLT